MTKFMLKLSAISVGLILPILLTCLISLCTHFPQKFISRNNLRSFFFLKVLQCIYNKRTQKSNFLSHKAMDPEEWPRDRIKQMIYDRGHYYTLSTNWLLCHRTPRRGNSPETSGASFFSLPGYVTLCPPFLTIP